MVLSVHFYSLSMSLWVAITPSVTTTSPPGLESSAALPGVSSLSSLWLLTIIINYIVPVLILWDATDKTISWTCYYRLPLSEPSKFSTLSSTQSIVLQFVYGESIPSLVSCSSAQPLSTVKIVSIYPVRLLFLRLLIIDFFFCFLLYTSKMGSIFLINLLSVVADRN